MPAPAIDRWRGEAVSLSVCMVMWLCASVSLSVCESVLYFYVSPGRMDVYRTRILMKTDYYSMSGHTTLTFSRSMVQRSRSDSDGHRNLVSSTASKPLTEFGSKLTQIVSVHSDHELRF